MNGPTRSTTRTRLVPILLLIMLALTALPASPAHAASFTVTTTSDSGAGSLRQALLDANAAAGDDTITFSVSGTITLSSTLPPIDDTVTIDGSGQSITISGNNAVQVLYVNPTKELNLRNLTIANGNSREGGGLYSLAGRVTVTNSTFSGNSADQGGAIWKFGPLTVSNSIFSGNSAEQGGAINGSELTVSNSTFSSNNASEGGAIYNYATGTVTNSTFSDNTADKFGGGISNHYSGRLSVSASTFSGNTAGSGGGISNDDSGTLSVSTSTFSGNTAGSGGGIWNHGDGTVTATNSTFSGNSASIYGGGIYNTATVTVTNSTFSGNNAPSVGAGIYNTYTGAATLRNTLVFHPSGNDCYGPGFVDGGGNLRAATCPGIFITDPLLGPLADNGGPTQTHAPGVGSPVRDAGVDADCPDTDQRGVVRPQGPHCDSGAVEMNVPPVAKDQSVTTHEDTPLAITLDSSDPEGQPLHFTVSTPPRGTLSGTAPNLTYTPAPDYNGTDSFSYTAEDDFGQSNSASVTITVVAVNDAPTFTKGADPVTVLEDMGAFSAAWATEISAGPADESDQPLAFLRRDYTNRALFSVAPAIATNGTLTFTPAPNANGSSTITIELVDNGGGAFSKTSGRQSFTISVTPVNDAPAFTAGTDQSVPPNSEPQTVAGWATGLTPGPTDESSQELTFQVSSDNPALFAVQPAIAPDGTLSYTPALGAVGSVLVTVRLADTGGTANGGLDTSAPQTFRFTIAYRFSGFFQPVDNLPTLNVVSAGRGVPVRFSLSGNYGLSIFAPGYPRSQPISCSDGVPSDAVEETPTASASGLTYDAANDTYTYMWKTEKSWAGQCRQLIVKLNDGAEHAANFRFK